MRGRPGTNAARERRGETQDLRGDEGEVEEPEKEETDLHCFFLPEKFFFSRTSKYLYLLRELEQIFYLILELLPK